MHKDFILGLDVPRGLDFHPCPGGAFPAVVGVVGRAVVIDQLHDTTKVVEFSCISDLEFQGYIFKSEFFHLSSSFPIFLTRPPPQAKKRKKMKSNTLDLAHPFFYF